MMYKKIIKRFFDISLGLLASPFVLLIIVLIGPLIYLEDRGNIFYISKRRGINGTVFDMYKLRSMKINAPDIRNADGSTYNSEEDSRITRVGSFLRKTSVDELPQIFNVIKGDMSIVGPRPTLATKSFEEIEVERRKRYDVKPGITGYTQAYYRNSISQQERYKWDLYYVDHESLLLDIKIIIRTFKTVLKRENIYIQNQTNEAEDIR